MPEKPNSSTQDLEVLQDLPRAKRSVPAPMAEKAESSAEASGSESEEDDSEYPEDYPDYYTSVEQELVDRNAINILTRREDVRGTLAIMYTIATFVMFSLGFVVAILDAAWRQVSIVDNLTTILPLISGIFLGTLGFVLGYYFRKVEGDGDAS